jgi:hypothetical protein
MKTWIEQLVAFVGRRKRPAIHGRMDWRGRPVAENPARAAEMVSLSKGALYDTLCPPSLVQDAGPARDRPGPKH